MVHDCEGIHQSGPNEKPGSRTGLFTKCSRHLGLLIDDSPRTRSRSSLNGGLHARVVAVAVMIRTGPFGLFWTDRRGVSRADCRNANSEVLSRITRGLTDCVESLRGPRKIAVAGNRGHLWGEQHRIETRTKPNHSWVNSGRLTIGGNYSRSPRVFQPIFLSR